MSSIEDQIKEQAQRLGFDLAGIAAAAEAETFAAFQHWLGRGHAGEMGYLPRHSEARRHPAAVLPALKSVVMVAMNYKPVEVNPTPGTSLVGKVARYARGVDYHELMWRQLDKLLAWVRQQVPGCRGRGVVDTAPLLERDFARRAGLGWFGKNAMLLHKHLGSYFFLGALLLDLELRPDPPHTSQHCGTCTACLDACPTQAFVGPGQLDARRCISYLTIEVKGSIAKELREPMGEWVFGCDVCQEVCPWNRKAAPTGEPAFHEAFPAGTVDLVELLSLTEVEFRQRFRHAPFWRPRRSGMRRNAAIVLGNRGDASALPALEKAALDDDAVVREAARWAIAQIRRSTAQLFPVSGSPASR
jgi:epoxyqueuosine reductase